MIKLKISADELRKDFSEVFEYQNENYTFVKYGAKVGDKEYDVLEHDTIERFIVDSDRSIDIEIAFESVDDLATFINNQFGD